MSHPNIDAEEIILGKGVQIDPSAKISGLNGKAKKIVIGDHSYIGARVQIMVDDFNLGDYGKIHHSINIHGSEPCSIGHNAWIGQYSILDCQGGLEIQNNCGIGAHSQLWSHIRYGDTLEGCRFKSEKKLEVGNDVWFVGHCIVSPIKAADKSMALVGSVVTHDMEENQIYAGNPAKSISEKVGYQFEKRSVDEKLKGLKDHLENSGISKEKIEIVERLDQVQNDERSYFVIEERAYTKKGNKDEIEFMKYLLSEKAKFTPLAN